MNSNLIEEKDFQIPEGFEQVQRPPITGAPPSAQNSQTSGIISSSTFGLNTDIAASSLPGNIPSYRIQPLGPSGQSQNNSSNDSSLLKNPSFLETQATANSAAAGVAAQAQTGWQGNWIDSVVYALGAIVEFNAVVYVSLQNQNLNEEPDTSPTFWQATGQVSFAGAWSSIVNYSIGQIVDSSGVFYIALQGPPNLNETPATSPTFWQPVGGTSQFLGNWSAIVNYQIGNQVIDAAGGGGYYIAIAASLNKQPSANPADWQLITPGNVSTFQGNYSGAVAYTVGQTVEYQGSQWVCISPTTGNAPSTTSSFWTLLGSNALFMGTWNSGTAYTQNMMIDWLGNFYQAIQASTNEQPDLNPTFWALTGPDTLDNLEDGTIYIRGIQYQSQTIVVPNSNFEASTSLPIPGWKSAGSVTLSYETSTPYAGNQSLKVSSTAQNGGADSIQLWACSPGDQFFVSAAEKSDGTGVPLAGLIFFDKTGTQIGQIYVANGTGTSWAVGTATGTAPANSVSFQLVLINNAVSQPSVVWFDSIFVVKAIDPSAGQVLAKGSTPLTQNTGLSYTSTTSAIDLIWEALALYRADGTITTIGSSSQNVTGLGSGRTFYAYPAYNEASATFKFISNSDVSFPTLEGIAYTNAGNEDATTTTSAALPAAFSLSFWVQVASGFAGAGGITINTSHTTLPLSSTNSVFNFEWSSGAISVGYRDSSATFHTIVSPQTYNDGEFHHVVYTCNPSLSQQFLYVDGVQVASGAVNTAVSATSGFFWLNRGASNTTMTGTLTEIAFFNSALLATNVAAIYNAGNAISQSAMETVISSLAPTIWWKSTDAGPTSIADSGSIGGNTGTAVNSPTFGTTAAVFGAIGSPAILWPSRSLLVSQVQAMQGNVPFTSGGWAVATPATGTGGGSNGGSSGGSGAGGCFSANTRVQTPTGNKRFDQLQPGDIVLDKNEAPRRILEVLKHDDSSRVLHDMGDGELITLQHVVFKNGEWMFAGKAFALNLVQHDGPIYNLAIEGEDFDSHSFRLANGVVAHNTSFS
jgi:hypothetical protein